MFQLVHFLILIVINEVAGRIWAVVTILGPDQDASAVLAEDADVWEVSLLGPNPENQELMDGLYLSLLAFLNSETGEQSRGFQIYRIPDVQVWNFKPPTSSCDASFRDSKWFLQALLWSVPTPPPPVSLLHSPDRCFVWCADLLDCEAPGAQRMRRVCTSRPDRPTCRWTANGLRWLHGELMSNESD